MRNDLQEFIQGLFNNPQIPFATKVGPILELTQLLPLPEQADLLQQLAEPARINANQFAVATSVDKRLAAIAKHYEAIAHIQGIQEAAALHVTITTFLSENMLPFDTTVNTELMNLTHIQQGLAKLIGISGFKQSELTALQEMAKKKLTALQIQQTVLAEKNQKNLSLDQAVALQAAQVFGALTTAMRSPTKVNDDQLLPVINEATNCLRQIANNEQMSQSWYGPLLVDRLNKAKQLAYLTNTLDEQLEVYRTLANLPLNKADRKKRTEALANPWFMLIQQMDDNILFLQALQKGNSYVVLSKQDKEIIIETLNILQQKKGILASLKKKMADIKNQHALTASTIPPKGSDEKAKPLFDRLEERSGRLKELELNATRSQVKAQQKYINGIRDYLTLWSAEINKQHANAHAEQNTVALSQQIREATSLKAIQAIQKEVAKSGIVEIRFIRSLLNALNDESSKGLASYQQELQGAIAEVKAACEEQRATLLKEGVSPRSIKIYYLNYIINGLSQEGRRQQAGTTWLAKHWSRKKFKQIPGMVAVEQHVQLGHHKGAIAATLGAVMASSSKKFQSKVKLDVLAEKLCGNENVELGLSKEEARQAIISNESTDAIFRVFGITAKEAQKALSALIEEASLAAKITDAEKAAQKQAELTSKILSLSQYEQAAIQYAILLESTDYLDKKARALAFLSQPQMTADPVDDNTVKLTLAALLADYRQKQTDAPDSETAKVSFIKLFTAINAFEERFQRILEATRVHQNAMLENNDVTIVNTLSTLEQTLKKRKENLVGEVKSQAEKTLFSSLPQLEECISTLGKKYASNITRLPTEKHKLSPQEYYDRLKAIETDITIYLQDNQKLIEKTEELAGWLAENNISVTAVDDAIAAKNNIDALLTLVSHGYQSLAQTLTSKINAALLQGENSAELPDCLLIKQNITQNKTFNPLVEQAKLTKAKSYPSYYIHPDFSKVIVDNKLYTLEQMDAVIGVNERSRKILSRAELVSVLQEKLPSLTFSERDIQTIQRLNQQMYFISRVLNPRLQAALFKQYCTDEQFRLNWAPSDTELAAINDSLLCMNLTPASYRALLHHNHLPLTLTDEETTKLMQVDNDSVNHVETVLANHLLTAEEEAKWKKQSELLLQRYADKVMIEANEAESRHRPGVTQHELYLRVRKELSAEQSTEQRDLVSARWIQLALLIQAKDEKIAAYIANALKKEKIDFNPAAAKKPAAEPDQVHHFATKPSPLDVVAALDQHHLKPKSQPALLPAHEWNIAALEADLKASREAAAVLSKVVEQVGKISRKLEEICENVEELQEVKRLRLS